MTDLATLADTLLANFRTVRARLSLLPRPHGTRPGGRSAAPLFVSDDAGLALLDELTEGMSGRGDPVSFDPGRFVLERIRHLFENDIRSSVCVTTVRLSEPNSVIRFLYADKHSHLRPFIT